MYNKNLIKNRNNLLLHDLITKAPNNTYIKKSNDKFKYKKLELSLEVLEIASNLDYKQYKGASILSKEMSVKNNAKSELLLTLIMLEKITGLLPKLIKAKKSVAGFNIRAGMDIGARVTLRKKHLQRLYLTLNMNLAPSTTSSNWGHSIYSKYEKLLLKNNYYNSICNSSYDYSLSKMNNLQPYSGWIWSYDNISHISKELTHNISLNISERKDNKLKELIVLSSQLKTLSELVGIHIKLLIKNGSSIKNTPLKHSLEAFVLSHYLFPY